MNFALKVVIGAVIVLLIAGALAVVMALGLWWLVPLAFPGLVFGFPNAVALTAIILLVGWPHLFKD